MKQNNKIILNFDVAEQLEMIRQIGDSNMLDINGAERSAYDHGFYELVYWMEDNDNEAYGRVVLFEGFVVRCEDGEIMNKDDFFEKYPVEIPL